MNVRVNVLYFIEGLCEQSLKADYTTYLKMIQRDLWVIVDAVAPNDPEGAANAETVRKVRGARLHCMKCLRPDSLTLDRCCRAYIAKGSLIAGH